MTAEAKQPSRMVVVVGVDMSDVNAHLLLQAQALIRPVDEAEVHVVHVVHPDRLTQRLERPIHAKDIGARSQGESAKWALQRLCAPLFGGPRTRLVVHVPVGDVARELTRIAAEARADILVTEAHEHEGHGLRRLFHRSVAARIAETAPCTVLTIRARPRLAIKSTAGQAGPSSSTWSHAGQ